MIQKYLAEAVLQISFSYGSPSKMFEEKPCRFARNTATNKLTNKL